MTRKKRENEDLYEHHHVNLGRDTTHVDLRDSALTQRRSKVDEELRLDELRACVGRDSSSLVPTKVGLISGVDVVRESQTLTTTPPTSEGTLDVSLSASATVGTTIHVLGDTKASAPIPEA
ncbi:hypothetical protein H5410_041350 [Solanum commersonii]|uniref:Uncharacterized protein n=1 Tax=Solanum commersonii TaxID=4109 RepID=A0A9J5XU97_SOLCO|nr:hypothetical protein H5410_041350 [Solanum commersonii]